MTIDPDNFITETTSAPPPATQGEKYLQLEVPSFDEQKDPIPGVPVPSNYVKADGTAGGAYPYLVSPTSFLRIGSSPNAAEWTTAPFQNSVNLARLVADPLAIAISEKISVQNGLLVGNLDTPGGPLLTATSIGGSSAPYTEGQAQTTTDITTMSSTFADAYVDGTPPTEGTPWSGTAFGSAQDPDFLIGFADDTRFRGPPETSESINATTTGLANNNNLLSPQNTLISNTVVPNVNANRMAETLKLLTKGGWWDHSDGNRVSTTMGDKVEVIQGNYKLVVLGRQPAPVPPPKENTVNLQAAINANSGLLAALTTWYDTWAKAGSVSGAWGDVSTITNNLTSGDGHGAVYVAGDVAQKFAYQVQVWLTTQNSFITDMSGGHFQEQYPSPTPCIKTVEYSQDNNNEWTLYQDNTQGNLITRLKGKTVDLFEGTSRESYVGTSDNTKLYASGSSTGTMTGDLRLDPMVASYTWAQSVYSQTGSEGKPIGFGPGSDNPSTKSSSGGPQPSGVTKGDVISKTWANRVQSYVGSVTSPVAHIFALTYAAEIETYTFAASHVTTTMGTNAFSFNGVLATEEVVIGAKLSLQAGVSVTFKAAADFLFGLTHTSVRGTNNSFDGGKLVVNASKDELIGVGTKVALALNHVADVVNHCDTTTVHLTNGQVTIATGAGHVTLSDYVLQGL